MFFEYVIQWLINLFHFGASLSSGGAPSYNDPSFTSGGSIGGTVKGDTTGGSIGSRHKITDPENVTAHFWSTGSPAWENQQAIIGGKLYKGFHFGADFSAPQGTPVYAPYPMRVIAIGHYDDPGRMGDYVIGLLTNDPSLEYYSGHLQNVRVARGASLEAGAQLGETNEYNHTHIQMKRGGVLLDPEEYLSSH